MKTTIFILTLFICHVSFAQKVRYRNVFKEMGYSQKDIDAKLQKAYYDVFEGPNKVYFEEEDSLAYVSDVKNKEMHAPKGCRTV